MFNAYHSISDMCDSLLLTFLRNVKRSDESVSQKLLIISRQLKSFFGLHTQDRLDYGFGTVVAKPVDADAIVITGSRRNVTMWEGWMDDVVELIRETTTPLYGICFGHQIIAHALGGKVERAEEDWHFVAEVVDESGDSIIASFAHQEYVVDAGELEVIASSNHCKIAACKHPTRPIHTVQYHPEAVSKVLDAALACGDMNHEERSAYDDKRLTTDVSIAFDLS